MTREHGFTLVEMLVAMTLVAFLTVLLFGGLRFGGRVWEHAQRDFRDQRAVRAATSLIERDLAAAYPLARDHGLIAFEGRAHDARWLSARPNEDGSMTALHLYRAGDVISLGAREELAPDRSETMQTVLRAASGLDFLYYGVRGQERSPRWGSDWLDQSTLPRLIRVIARRSNAPGIDLTIAPRIDGAAGCLFDAASNTCRGG